MTRLTSECQLAADIVPGGRELICADVQHSNDAWMVEDFDPNAGR